MCSAFSSDLSAFQYQGSVHCLYSSVSNSLDYSVPCSNVPDPDPADDDDDQGWDHEDAGQDAGDHMDRVG